MACLSVFHSADPNQLGVRMARISHCFNDKNEGGHYYYDLSTNEDSEEMEYDGYFSIAYAFVQINKPKVI